MPIQYQGVTLTKDLQGPKVGGKNSKHPLNGFYTGNNGQKYFIKVPICPEEIFPEAFAGFLITEFKTEILKELIEEQKEIFHEGCDASLVCADVIYLGNNLYGLIQDRLEFKELFKEINTGYYDGSDRSPLWEMVQGPDAYAKLIEGGSYFGLSLALFFSLLLSANSVHSSNIVCMEKASLDSPDNKVTQHARIDWGDAFRDFAASNNQTILKPAEYAKLFSFYKKYTKGYIDNYRKLPGLKTSMAEKARLIQQKINEKATINNQTIEAFLEGMVNKALSKIPANLIGDKQKGELASYMGISSFATIKFGVNEKQAAATEFASTLAHRLSLLTELKDASPPLYSSLRISQASLAIATAPAPADSNFDKELPSPEQDSPLKTPTEFEQQQARFATAEDKLTFFDSLQKAYYALPPESQLQFEAPFFGSVHTIWQEITQEFECSSMWDKQFYFGNICKFYEMLRAPFNKLYQDEYNFYAEINAWEACSTLGEKIARITKVRSYLSTCVQSGSLSCKTFYYQNIDPRHGLYTALFNQGIYPSNKPIDEIDLTLDGLRTLLPERQDFFIANVVHDKILWKEIQTQPAQTLPSEIIDDLLALKNFQDEKLAYYGEARMGKKAASYQVSINNFYQQAVKIRLSNKPAKEQAEAILNIAHQEFHHRHRIPRLLADVMMILTFFFGGALVGLGRLATGRTFFFSQASTARETAIKDWVKIPRDEEMFNEARLVVSPA